jgi:hypothetical protein
MKSDALLGVWTGTVHNNNGWDMKITISILQPFEVGGMLGVFDIPLLPCSGIFRVLTIQGQTLHLQVERLLGDCAQADAYSLELLPDGTLRYSAQGKEGATRGVLQRTNI